MKLLSGMIIVILVQVSMLAVAFAGPSFSLFTLQPKTSEHNSKPNYIEFVRDGNTGFIAIERCDRPDNCDQTNTIGGREYYDSQIESAISGIIYRHGDAWTYDHKHHQVFRASTGCALGAFVGIFFAPVGGPIWGTAVGCAIGATGAKASGIRKKHRQIDEADEVERYYDHPKNIVKFDGSEELLVSWLEESLAVAVKESGNLTPPAATDPKTSIAPKNVPQPKVSKQDIQQMFPDSGLKPLPDKVDPENPYNLPP